MALQSSVSFSIIKAPPIIFNRFWFTLSVSTQCYFEGHRVQPVKRGVVIVTGLPASPSSLHRASMGSQQYPSPPRVSFGLGRVPRAYLSFEVLLQLLNCRGFCNGGEVGGRRRPILFPALFHTQPPKH